MAINHHLHVTHIASGDLWAGAEVQLFALCNALNNIPDVKVSVILLNYGTLENKLREHKIDVKVLDETSFNSFHIFISLIKHLKYLKPDVVHTHRIKENILGAFAAKIVNNTPSLRTIHGSPEHRPSLTKPHKYFFYLVDWFAARFIQKKIIAVSEDLKTLLKKSYPIKKLHVIENGVDTNALAPFKQFKPYKKDITNNFFFKVGLVGRLVPIKRIDLFIEIAKYMQNHYPKLSVQFHIYGDGALRDELTKLTYSLEIESNVKFEGHRDDIHEQIATLDALLITSDHEGLPITLLEAMALGTPVLSHNVGGINKVCQNGKYCWLVDENSVETFGPALAECLRTSHRDRIALAQNHIEQHYTAEVNAQSFMSLYNMYALNNQ